MKLPEYEGTLQDNLAEFDVWITASLGEIRDTEGFNDILHKLVQGFDAISAVTNDFAQEDACHPKKMGAELQKVFGLLPTADAVVFLQRIISVLYLVTGKSDNNAKCQFPLFLRDRLGILAIPTIKKRQLVEIGVPRVLGEDRIIPLVARLAGHPTYQAILFQHFIEFILSDERYISQLWSVGHSYVKLSRIGKGADLLSPLAVFQVRGSVSAKGGHTPERILRERLADWGLRLGLDYNEADVNLTQLHSLPPEDPSKVKEKTRAWDFAIPIMPRDDGKRLLIQSQFYAGDSGSVSHKNVDQVGKSRRATKEHFPDSVFVEYVDGAGYFASLNGDLRSLMSLPDTSSFFQIRSAPIRLRRELQSLGLLTPLDVEHGILIVGPERAGVEDYLRGEGYPQEEIDVCIQHSLERGLISTIDGDALNLSTERRSVVRRYFLLDIAAIYGAPLKDGKLAGYVLLPGYGPFYGLKQNDLIRHAEQMSPLLKQDWQDTAVAFDDLQWLMDASQQFIMLGR